MKGERTFDSDALETSTDGKIGRYLIVSDDVLLTFFLEKCTKVPSTCKEQLVGHEERFSSLEDYPMLNTFE